MNNDIVKQFIENIKTMQDILKDYEEAIKDKNAGKYTIDDLEYKMIVIIDLLKTEV